MTLRKVGLLLVALVMGSSAAYSGPESRPAVMRYPSPPAGAVLVANLRPGWAAGVWRIRQSDGYHGEFTLNPDGTGTVRFANFDGITRRVTYRTSSKKFNDGRGDKNYGVLDLTFVGLENYMADVVNQGGLRLINGWVGGGRGQTWTATQVSAPQPQTPPISVRPTRPISVRPTRPVEPEPTRPVEPEPARPVEPEPARPVEPEPARPVEPEPTRPVEPPLRLNQYESEIDGKSVTIKLFAGNSMLVEYDAQTIKGSYRVLSKTEIQLSVNFANETDWSLGGSRGVFELSGRTTGVRVRVRKL